MSASTSTRRINLPPRSEYRFELEGSERISLRLLTKQQANSGESEDAEIFGAEMVGGTQERWYPFGDEAKVAVSSWNGAEIELAGQASTEYLADEPSPTYTSYSNLHLYLERARILARSSLRQNPSLISSLASSVSEDSFIPPTFPDPSSSPSSTTLKESGPGTSYRPEGQGPRVMILGPESSGKTSLVKFLANYALRSPAIASLGKGKAQKVEESMKSSGSAGDLAAKEEEERKRKKKEGKDQSEITGWWPVVVNLDPSEGAPPLPCCISALPLSPLPLASLPSPSPAFPYGTSTSTTGAIPPGPSTAHGVAPLSLWVGRESMRDNEMHSKRVVDWLAEGVERRLARDMRSRMSGLIVDTPGVTTADARSRYSFIQHCVRAFKIDTIIVLGHEKLNIEMTKVFGGNPPTLIPGLNGAPMPRVNVIKLPKSGGVVELDETYKQRLRSLQVRSYFYGGSLPKVNESHDPSDPSSKPFLPGHSEPLGGLPTLNPYSTTIPLDLLEIYRVGQASPRWRGSM
ncbi:hypothetical protein IE53DRAFT_410064 [Violaceomyces palustris]|uniref:Uncharacterized protein n=1 Tax=Violaceomyces palustris TaxID=1673888 RepID=A0ACD0P0H0_9BASI|nr:hypothetical protein IE53DRAFT_410064 [Violaceomyces palustris]